MIDIKYHPLVNCNTDGTIKVPMFFSGDETAVRNAHRPYLEENIPKYYRLRSVNGISPKTAEAYIIRCTRRA